MSDQDFDRLMHQVNAYAQAQGTKAAALIVIFPDRVLSIANGCNCANCNLDAVQGLMDAMRAPEVSDDDVDAAGHVH